MITAITSDNLLTDRIICSFTIYFNLNNYNLKCILLSAMLFLSLLGALLLINETEAVERSGDAIMVVPEYGVVFRKWGVAVG